MRWFEMRVISRRALVEYGKDHADAVGPLDRWYRITDKADWQSFDDVRQTFPSADYYKTPNDTEVVVFNIGGNNHRLIAGVRYEKHIVFVLEIMTHPEYDKESWKERL
jgi:mRNA interferase HigB